MFYVTGFVLQVFSSDDPGVESVIKQLVFLYQQRGKYDMAKPLYEQVVKIRDDYYLLFLLFSRFLTPTIQV